MRALLIANRAAGSAGAADAPTLLSERGVDFDVAQIATASSWSREEARRVAGDVERVIVAGGDGSLGCAAQVATWLEVPLAVLPLGTANDFARALGLPDDPGAAAALAVDGSTYRTIDLAAVCESPFVNVASVGIAPRAAARAQSLKAHLRALAYPLGALLALVRSRPTFVTARVDGEPVWAGKTWQTMVASTGAFGGWAQTGAAQPDDRQLDLVIVPARRATRKLIFDAASLLRGELAKREGVQHFRGTRIELGMRRAPRLVVDGELVRAGSADISAQIEGPPVRLVVPRPDRGT
jgi:YegS/Rv2252/BmrU family lipid kinase